MGSSLLSICPFDSNEIRSFWCHFLGPPGPPGPPGGEAGSGSEGLIPVPGEMHVYNVHRTFEGHRPTAKML